MHRMQNRRTKNSKKMQNVHFRRTQFIVILQMECAALVQMHFLRQNGSEWDYSMPNINITSIWTLSSTGCIPAVFLTDVPSVSCPITQQHGAVQSLFKRDFPSSFGEVLLTLHKLCDIRWWETAIKRCCICFTCVCLLVRMGASWNWFCEVWAQCTFPVFPSVTHSDTEICLREGKTMRDNN